MICEDLNSLVILCAYHIEVLPGQTPFIQTVASHGEYFVLFVWLELDQ